MRRQTLTVRYVEYMPQNLEEGILYISEKYSTAIHLCACGCGERVVTPLGADDWHIDKSSDGITLRPSVGNFQFPCRSHYFITNNKVEWL